MNSPPSETDEPREVGDPADLAPRRRARAWVVVAVVVLVFGVWSLASIWLVVSAQQSLEAGRSRLEAVREGATPSSLLDPGTEADLDAAGTEFADARTALRNPVLAPWRVLPVAGRHLRAADRVVATAQGSTALASTSVADLQDLAAEPVKTGPQRVEALERLSAIIDRARAGLDDLDPGSPDDLAGPLSRAVAKLATERAETRDGLDHAAQATRALTSVLKGPSPYLLLGANNAEMRAGSGMFLSAAPVRFEDGDFRLGDVRPTEELVLPAGTVKVSGDLAENWPWLDSGRDLRSLGFTPDFPQSAPLAAANWARVDGGGQVDGVIAVDVDALRALLRVVGPVEVDGVRYTADTVRGELLRNQYRRYGDRTERRDQVGAVARAVFARIQSGDWQLDELATALVDSVSRRHLMIWSRDERTEAAWATVGAAGRLQDRSLAVSMLNRGAEKLDSFLPATAELTSRRRDDGRVAIHLTYTVENRAPADGPTYLLGPNIAGFAAGEHRGIVVVDLPRGSTDVVLRGGRQLLLGQDGRAVVTAAEVGAKRGGTMQVRVSAVLPRDVDEVVLEPSARIPATTWVVDGKTYRLDRRRTVRVGDS